MVTLDTLNWNFSTRQKKFSAKCFVFLVFPELDKKIVSYKAKGNPIKCFFGHVEYSFDKPLKSFREKALKFSRGVRISEKSSSTYI